MDDETSAGDLKHQQEVKEQVEREEAAEAIDEAEAATHRRRADKASYLQEKLAERERAEAETPPDES
jgi:hypothetical protein